jgi:WD40 repeat protein
MAAKTAFPSFFSCRPPSGPGLAKSAVGKELHRFDGHSDAVDSVAFSPDGHLLLSSGVDKSVRLWDVANKRQMISCHHAAKVRSALFLPDGVHVLFGGYDHSVRLWALPG